MSNKKNGVKPSRLCNICMKTITGSSYKFKSHLYQHRAIPARFKCTFCSKEYFRTDEFRRHMETHTGSANKKQYICDHCDRSFAEKRNLILHLPIHDEGPLYKHKCIACGATYCEARLLKYHIRKTHYNLKSEEPAHVKKELNETWVETIKESQICVQMTKVNNNVISIKKYAKIKSEHKKPEFQDEKLQLKQYISSVFAQKDSSQYSKAKCDYCHKEMLKKSLLAHIRERHLKIKKFACEVCRRSFSRHYQLVDHCCGPPRRRPRTHLVKH